MSKIGKISDRLIPGGLDTDSKGMISFAVRVASTHRYGCRFTR